MQTITVDLLVVGSGISGAYAALAACSYGAQVVVASKTPLIGGSTRWAQGGIAAPTMPADEVAHAQDTFTAGRGLCDPATVQAFVSDARIHVETLMGLGVAFADEYTLEGGHSKPRIRFSADATGLVISEALALALQKSQGAALQLYECSFVQHLRVEGGHVIGADILTPTGPLRVLARGVLLATGGYGRLFPVTTSPPEGTGDGLSLAYSVGATLRDLEFVQFHPTAVVVDGQANLVTEAARGEGGYLVNAVGKRFMHSYDPLLELAPRDVVARAIAAEREATGNVYLDMRHLEDEMVRQRFPTICENLSRLNLDLVNDLIPVHPAVHYTIGGIQTDVDGRATIPGLYAAGEVASSGLHGANRLASNSLSEGLVFGARAARAALSENQLPQGEGEAQLLPLADPQSLAKLRHIVGQSAGLIRSAETLQTGLEALSDLLGNQKDLPRNRETVEAGSLHLLAPLLLRAALGREESRGGHARSDFPELADPVHSLQWLQTGEKHLLHKSVDTRMLRYSLG